jgi:hypothetical protein
MQATLSNNVFRMCTPVTVAPAGKPSVRVPEASPGRNRATIG